MSRREQEEVEDDGTDDATVLGLQVEYDEDDEDEQSEADDDGLFAVWPENWESVMVFAACWSQWNITVIPMGMAGSITSYEGLDNSKVRDTMAMMRVKNEKAVLQDLRLMEAEARPLRTARANRK